MILDSQQRGSEEAAMRIDESELSTWHYPTNKPLRDYQLAMARTALSSNTLIVLPTGLGKTFIAAVAIYNFCRWFPSARCVFVAPSRPLVAQQMAAFTETVGMVSATVELTAGQPPMARAALWQSRNLRVFFCTPQILHNDLLNGGCPPDGLCLIVFDEAHRALGNHVYYQIVRVLGDRSIRLVGLSATPAAQASTVQEVIDNLAVEKIEFRTELSPDVKPYVFGRSLSIVKVPAGPDLSRFAAVFLKSVIEPQSAKLRGMCSGSIAVPPAASLFSHSLFKLREAFRSANRNRALQGPVEGLFGMLISLVQAYELLLFYGYSTFLSRLDLDAGQGDGSLAIRTRIRNELASNPEFLAMRDEMTTGGTMHPKLEKLLFILNEPRNGPLDAKGQVIIFSHFRESVLEIVNTIAAHCPGLRAHQFIGQANDAGISQKDQLRILDEFRNGRLDVLVATSIGEEGLDIGSVDIIVCYDVQSSPIRMQQRLGRTARHRPGKVFLLLSEEREEQQYARGLEQQNYVSSALLQAEKHFRLGTRPHPLKSVDLVCIKRVFEVQEQKAALANSQKPTAAFITLQTLDMAPVLKMPVNRESTPVHLVTHSKVTMFYLSLLSPAGLAEKTAGASVTEDELFVADWIKRHMELINTEHFFVPEHCYGRMQSLLQSAAAPIRQVEERGCDISMDLPEGFFDDSSSDTEAVDVHPVPKACFSSPTLVPPAPMAIASSPIVFRTPMAKVREKGPAASKKRLTVIESDGPSSPIAATPVHESARREPRTKKTRSRFVESEAGVSGSDTDDDVEEELTSSMQAFIDDASQVSTYKSSQGRDRKRGHGSPEGSQDMMAFYRQSLFSSQPTALFAQPPRQFARKLKMKIEYSTAERQSPSTSTSTSSATATTMNESAPISDQDGPSLTRQCLYPNPEMTEELEDALKGMEWSDDPGL